MIPRVGEVIERYVTEDASYHVSKPIYWLIAYRYNTHSNSNGYLRYGPGKFKWIEAEEEITEREIGRAESMVSMVPAIVYICALAVTGVYANGVAGLPLILVFGALALLAIEQHGEVEISVSRKTSMEASHND